MIIRLAVIFRSQMKAERYPQYQGTGVNLIFYNFISGKLMGGVQFK